jgi:hypothetical protein
MRARDDKLVKKILSEEVDRSDHFGEAGTHIRTVLKGIGLFGCVIRYTHPG